MEGRVGGRGYQETCEKFSWILRRGGGRKGGRRRTEEEVRRTGVEASTQLRAVEVNSAGGKGREDAGRVVVDGEGK